MFQLQGAQGNIYAFEKLHPNTATFRQNLVVEIQGLIDVPLFERALIATTARHEALRSYFSADETGVYQMVTPVSDVTANSLYAMTVIDATKHAHTPPLALQQTLADLNVPHITEASFDLEKGPLWRAALIKFSDDCHQFVFLAHHLIIDETSLGIVLNDISAHYNALLTNEAVNLPAIPAMSELASLQPSDDEIQKRRSFWTENLKGLSIPKLPTDNLNDPPFQFRGKHHRFNIGSEIVDRLKLRFKDQSMNNLMLACMTSLIHRYTNENDFCIGITSANRRHPSSAIDATLLEKHVVNCFFNSLPVRLNINPQSTLEDVLPHIKSAVGQAAKNQLPLDEVFEHCLSHETKLNLRTASPFSVLLKTYKNKPTLSLANTTATHPVELDLGSSKFSHFGLSVDEMADGSFTCFIEYNTDLYQHLSIERLAQHFTQAVITLSEQPNQTLDAIPLLAPDELSEIRQYNNTQRPIPFKSIPDYLHEIAVAHPDRTALVFHDDDRHTTMSYQTLDEQSTQLAHVLDTLQLPLGTAIGVCLTRGPALLVASFAVFKAGLTLVTIENHSASKDIRALKSSALTHVITDTETNPLFEASPVTPLNLDSESLQTQLAAASTDYTAKPLVASSSIYTMYTSGTTGTPKAVGLTHGGFTNLYHWLTTRQMQANLRVISTALPTFDAFYYDVLVCLATLGELHLTTESNRYSPEVISAIAREFQLQFGCFLPDFIDSLDPTLPFTHIVSMGASPHADNLNEWIRHNPSIRIENGLGHTETGICLMQHPFNPKTPAGLIGQPLDNMAIYLIDPHSKALCPMGVAGELYVAGPGVAIGYLNQPELSETKFITLKLDLTQQRLVPCNPHDEGAQRMYATGDFGCYRYDQEGKLSILFIGRKDRQMKINGVRIELDGIERLLRTHQDIQEVVVLPNSENTALRAFIQPTDPETELTSAEFRINILKHFSNTLFPMVGFPREINLLDSIPLTVNGKVDTKALLRIPSTPEPDNYLTDNEDPILKVVVHLWATILGLNPECMSIKEPIWALGGNSINRARFERLINFSTGLQFSTYLSQAILQNGQISLSELAGVIRPYLLVNSTASVTPFSMFAPTENTTPATPGFPSNENYDIQSRGINNKPNH